MKKILEEFKLKSNTDFLPDIDSLFNTEFKPEQETM
jgi:hypothetical protein